MTSDLPCHIIIVFFSFLHLIPGKCRVEKNMICLNLYQNLVSSSTLQENVNIFQSKHRPQHQSNKQTEKSGNQMCPLRLFLSFGFSSLDLVDER